jgi:WD40 repeat protein
MLAACAGQQVNPGDARNGPPPTFTPLPWQEPAGPISGDNAAQALALGRLDVPGTPSTMFAFAISPDSTRLVGLDNDQMVGWNLVTGKLLFTTARQNAIQVYYSPDKTEFYSVDDQGTVNILSPDDGVKRNSLKGQAAYNGVSAYYADEGWLALGGNDGTVKVWDTAKRESVIALKGHRGSIAALAFSPDGEQLATAGAEGVVYVWRWREGTKIATLDHQGAIAARIVFSPDGKQLTVGTNTYLAVWSIADSKLSFALQTGTGGASDVLMYSPDGKYLLNGGLVADMSLWNATTGERVTALPGVGGDRVSAAFSPDGSMLVTSLLKGGVSLWDIAHITNKTVNRADLKVPSKNILYVNWTPDGYLMIFVDANGPVYIWGVPKSA